MTWVRMRNQLPEQHEEEKEKERKKSTSWTKEGKKKCRTKQNKKRVQEMTSHSPLFPLLPQVVQETASGCRDTMGSAHIRCSPLQWQGPYTDMMCLTKAADEDQGSTHNGQKRGNMSE